MAASARDTTRTASGSSLSIDIARDRDSEKADTLTQQAPEKTASGALDFDDVDIYAFHEQQQGRLVIDPAEARSEFGDAFAARLKLSRDGTKVLWPQPTPSPDDPQNWSDRKKALQLLIITLAAVVPDFDSSIGIAGLFALADQFGTTTGEINNLTSNWSIFLLGPGGMVAVALMRRYGRLPVLFWSQLLALAALIGCTFAPNLHTFAAFRCLNGFFATCPQVTGLFVVTDIYPFHLQARKLNIWTMGFIGSPFLGPFLLGFMVPRSGWRWAYGVGCIYGALVLCLIALLGEETTFDRTVRPLPPRPTPSSGARYRVHTLIGVTGARMARYRASWADVVAAPFRIVWRPQILGVLVWEGLVFGFGIGINVTNPVFLGTPSPGGLGFKPDAISATYATPIVAVLLGELIGRFANDYIMGASLRRSGGVWEAEFRLRACYGAMALYVCGFVTLGAAIQRQLGAGALIMGWGIAECAIMVNTVAVYAYLNDCFPKHQGEISALINLARTLGGFAVAYFQVPWASKHGALQTFGVEAAIVVALFLLTVPFVQVYGRSLRVRYSI